MDGFADGALSGSITGAISGALAASPAGLGLQIAGNAGLSGVSYTVQNIDSFSVEGLLLNMGVGAAAGYVGGSGWLSKGSPLPIDIALNGTGNTLAILGSSGFATFGAPILKVTVVRSTASGIEIVKTLIDKIRGGE